MPDGISVSAGRSHVAIYYKVLPRLQQTVPGYSQIQVPLCKEQLPKGNICSPSLMGLIVRFLSPRSVCLHTTCPSLCPTSKKYPKQYRSHPEVLVSYLTHKLVLSTNLISFLKKENKHRWMDFDIWKNCIEFSKGNLNQAVEKRKLSQKYRERERNSKPSVLFLFPTGSFSVDKSASPQYTMSDQ